MDGTLKESEYYKLTAPLRMCISVDEPFSTLERFWTVTDGQDSEIRLMTELYITLAIASRF